jgi:hypothetical protein
MPSLKLLLCRRTFISLRLGSFFIVYRRVPRREESRPHDTSDQDNIQLMADRNELKIQELHGDPESIGRIESKTMRSAAMKITKHTGKINEKKNIALAPLELLTPIEPFECPKEHLQYICKFGAESFPA